VPAVPIGLLALEAGLHRGIRCGLWASAGVATADLLYSSVTALAGHALEPVITPHRLPLEIASGILLILLGAWGVWRATRARRLSEADVAHPPPGITAYFRLFIITAVHPLTVIYFAALIVPLQAREPATTWWPAAFVAGVTLASFTWHAALAGFGAAAHRFASPRFQMLCGIGGGLVIAGIGVRHLLGAA
jgi:threonine/homoserine/homoserine lactone efflux protein